MSLALFAPLFLAGGALPPLRPSRGPIDAGWQEAAAASDGQCELTVTGNGKTFLISATGLGANAPARFVLTNGDMKPIDWGVRANASGRFARYYLPFRWQRTGGTVTVTVANEDCTLSSSFEWRRVSATAY